MTMIDKSKLKELALAATRGPWMRLFGERTVYDRMEDGCRGNAIVRSDIAYDHNDAKNLDFIAAANPAAILELLAEDERKSARIAELLAELETAKTAINALTNIISAKDVATTTSTEPKGDGITDDTEAIQRLNEPKGQDSHVMPPFAAPAGQHDAGASVLSDDEVLDVLGQIDPEQFGLPESGPDYAGYDLACARAIEAELASRGAAQGRITSDIGGASPAPSAKQEPSEEVLALHRALASEKLRADQGWERAEAKSRECIELREKFAAPSASASPAAPIHDSDCSLHNEPAFPAGPCDCSVSAPVAGSQQVPEVVREALEIAHDLAVAEAERVHETYKGYKPDRHAAVDVDVQTVKDAIAVLAAAPAVPVPAEQGWISVKDELPGFPRSVLVARHSDADGVPCLDPGVAMLYPDGKWRGIGVFYAMGKQPPYEMRETAMEVTHWMPLPAAPSLQQGKEGAGVTGFEIEDDSGDTEL